MKKKLFLISSVLFFASSILFAQYDFSIKAYTIFGNIQTKHIDKYHIGRFKFKRDFENINNSNFEAPKLVSDGLNYGLELTYNILSNLSLGVGYERSGNSSNSFDYSSGDQGFPPRPQFWIAEKLIFDFQSIPINIFCKISVIKNFSAYANAGIQLNFGDFSHSKSFY